MPRPKADPVVALERRREKHRRWVAANLELKRASNLRYAKSERGKAMARAYGARNRDRQFWSFIKTEYGVTPDQWRALFAAQGNCCGMCGADEPSPRYGRWHTDHDHDTGKIRGILCQKCNLRIGFAGDTREAVDRWYANACRYLGGPHP